MPYGNYWIAECLVREMSEDWSVLSKMSPVQLSTTVELIVNLKTAKTLGFTVRLVPVLGDPSLRPAVAGTKVAPAPRRSNSPAVANSGQPAVHAARSRLPPSHRSIGWPQPSVWTCRRHVNAARRVSCDRDNDRLHMMVAVALQRRPASLLRKCLYPRRIVGLFIIPFGRVVRHGISLLLNVGWLGATNLPVPHVSSKSADEGPHRRDRRAGAVEWFLTARRFERAAPVC
jgi:hypothetical protein